MKLVALKNFSWAHAGVRVEHFEKDDVITTDDADLIKVAQEEGWAAKPGKAPAPKASTPAPKAAAAAPENKAHGTTPENKDDAAPENKVDAAADAAADDQDGAGTDVST